MRLNSRLTHTDGTASVGFFRNGRRDDFEQDRYTNSNEPRTALVIGNSSYINNPLKNPVNDARDIANILKKLEFEVIHKENASQRDMENAIRKFGKVLRKGGVGLFFYAGHGIQIKGENYLIPIGANIETEIDTKYEAVNVNMVINKMYEAENRVNLVLLDACRNNPFARSFRSVNRGLAIMDAPTGTFIAFATAPGSVASDGDGRNGIFTSHLLHHINTPNRKIEDVMKYVRKGVINETNNKQVPWQSSSLTGDFYFVN